MEQASFAFHSTDPRRSRELITKTLEVCESIDGLEFGSSTEQIQPEDFSVDEPDGFELYWQNGSGTVSIGFNYKPIPEHFLDIFTQRKFFIPDDDEGEYEGLIGAVVELVRQLAIEHDPYYVVSPDLELGMGVHPTDVMPTTTDFELGRIPWFGVYSPPLIEDLGGREHVLATPAWRVEELPTGSILLIRTRAPWAQLGRDHPVDRHLLGETK